MDAFIPLNMHQRPTFVTRGLEPLEVGRVGRGPRPGLALFPWGQRQGS